MKINYNVHVVLLNSKAIFILKGEVTEDMNLGEIILRMIYYTFFWKGGPSEREKKKKK